MGHKRRHKAGQIRERDYTDGYSDQVSTRYQQAIRQVDQATRESEVCWNDLIGEK